MSDYPTLNFEITEEHIEIKANSLSEKTKKKFRKFMYKNNIENYGIFIDGIHGTIYHYDTKTMNKISKRQVKWRNFKAGIFGWWFDITYKRRYKNDITR